MRVYIEIKSCVFCLGVDGNKCILFILFYYSILGFLVKVYNSIDIFRILVDFIKWFYL